MKKKVVALLTLAMFVMTLLPVAAFADTVQAVPEYSWIAFEDDQTNPTVDIDETLIAEAHMYAQDNENAPGTMERSVVWVTKKGEKTPIINATIDLVENDSFTGDWDGSMYEAGVYLVEEGITDGDKIGIKVATAGEYTLHVGQLQWDIAEGKALPKELDDQKGYDFVVAAVDADSMTFVDENGKALVANDDDVATLTKAQLEATNFEYNGVDTYKVTGTLLDENKKPMKRQEITLSSNKDNLVLEDETVTTNRKGEFDIEFSLNDEVNATVTITYGDLEYTLKVDAAENDLDSITTTKEGGYVLAGKDNNYDQASKFFSTAVQFEITDKNGAVVEGNLPATEIAGDAKDTNHDKYIKVTKPSNSTLKPKALELAWDDEEEVYTLKYVGTNPKKDLVEGEYTVTVALLNGDSAKATFNVAKFGDVKDLVVKTYYKKGYNNKVATDNEIALGDDLFVEAKYVDENGIEILANKSNVQIGVDGKAVKRENKANPGWYELKDNTTANESLIGTTIKVTAFDSKEKKLATKELTVVDAYKTYSLSFDNKEGKVNVDNNVKVSIVDKNGKVADEVNGIAYAYVDSQSNKDAKVTVEKVPVDVEQDKRADYDVIKGKFNIKVYANQPTTADIVVGVKADNGAIYAGTLTYTFGEESIPAGTSVVMTLGSTEMIVNNQLVDMKDAAPFAQDNRTFVPFRALGEALGATVDYDQTAKTVTYKLGSSEIVMTLDSKDYTVNGVKKTMDVAPFAKDNRTYVPVRFVGEGLGFTVTGLTNANGQYVAVAFTK